MDEFLDSSTLRKCAFGLVDPKMAEILPCHLVTHNLVPKGLTSSSHLMPVLLDLRQNSNDGWDTLLTSIRNELEKSRQPPVALFITTEVSVDEFSRHWNLIQLARPQPSRKLWLRTYDPRVLHQLLRILNSAQRRRLYGRSQAFHYWIGGKWITAQRDTADDFASDGSSGGTVGWDWSRIQSIGLVNRALLGAGINEASELTTQAALAERLIKRAVNCYGLNDHADLVEFTVRGLLTAPTFDEHPVIARAIRAIADSTGDARLADRFALIEEHVWEAVRYSVDLLTGHRI